MILCLLLSFVSHAQDVESIADADPVVLTGGLRLGSQFYRVSGIGQRAAPFQFTASGRLNLAIYEEFNIPFSFAIGRQRPSLQFPVYRQFGLSPRYKWLTVHGGYRNIRLSNFTLNNHTFLGGGVEINPGKLRIAAMYGRLRQGLREVTENIDLFFDQPVYNRFAWGGRVGWGSTSSHLDFVYFRAEDRDTNIDFPDSLSRPRPAENIVLGLEWRQQIGKRIDLNLEAAASGFNRNLNSQEFPVEEYRGHEFLSRLFAPKYSTQAGLALKGGANYRHRGFNAGIDYERIDPGFESMGTYFLNGDWENIRGKLGFGLFKQKLRLQGSLGIQRNNLYEQRAETSRRTIGSLFVSLRMTDRSNLSGNYSNFNQDHRPSALVVYNDTLRIASTTENYGLTWSLSGKGGKGQPMGTFVATINFQSTNNDNPLSEGFDDLSTRFASLNYSLRLGNETTTFSVGANQSSVDVSDRLTVGLGGTLGWRQQLGDRKFSLNVTNTFNRNTVDGESDGFSNALRANLSWRAGKLHTFTLGASWLERNSERGLGFSEQRGNVGYGLTLPAVGRKKKPGQ